jgi:hypothetical protein
MGEVQVTCAGCARLAPQLEALRAKLRAFESGRARARLKRAWRRLRRGLRGVR